METIIRIEHLEKFKENEEKSKGEFQRYIWYVLGFACFYYLMDGGITWTKVCYFIPLAFIFWYVFGPESKSTEKFNLDVEKFELAKEIFIKAGENYNKDSEEYVYLFLKYKDSLKTVVTTNKLRKKEEDRWNLEIDQYEILTEEIYNYD